ncbi:MAG: hypothetical protein CL961_07080 [Euryarchaeota archaeon]|nr:hypothetical protein [Euryarchaeota archaeon]|tara:strand:- start:1036 stop:1374 length:339 start_codon:yes stop_codon:yes gene_type:complete
MNNHQVFEYQTIVENYIAGREKATLVLRNVGPRAITDEAKRDQVYDTYRMLLHRDVFTGLLNNEIIFVEFDSIDEAEDYATNFPRNPGDGDPDFYILAEVYGPNGGIEYHNR